MSLATAPAPLTFTCSGEEARAIRANGWAIVWRRVRMDQLRIHLPRHVRSDVPFPPYLEAAPGAHPAHLNAHGAVSAVVDGKTLGVKPGEFHFLNRFVHGETTLRSYARIGRRWTLTPKEATRCLVSGRRVSGPPLHVLVVDARLGPVHDITEREAKAGGVSHFFERFPSFGRDQTITSGELASRAPHRAAFAVRWDERYGSTDDGLWIRNPWSLRFELKVVP